MKFPLFQIDAFAERVFEGNSAAVCPLDAWLTDEQLQAIAMENNLSETAFLVAREVERVESGEQDESAEENKRAEEHRSDGASDEEPGARAVHFELRWFTPTSEVNLCGHATLASAHWYFEHSGLVTMQDGDEPTVRFSTRSGVLECRRLGEGIQMAFPVIPCLEMNDATTLKIALGLGHSANVDSQDVGLFQAGEDLLVCVPESLFWDFTPDLHKIGLLKARGVIMTTQVEAVSQRRLDARGIAQPVDFVSRFFAPAVGIDEDPVTGSAHCALAPFWADRLGKSSLTGYQASARGGLVKCDLIQNTLTEKDEVGDNRDADQQVLLTGSAVTYLEGQITI